MPVTATCNESAQYLFQKKNLSHNLDADIRWNTGGRTWLSHDVLCLTL